MKRPSSVCTRLFRPSSTHPRKIDHLCLRYTTVESSTCGQSRHLVSRHTILIERPPGVYLQLFIPSSGIQEGIIPIFSRFRRRYITQKWSILFFTRFGRRNMRPERNNSKSCLKWKRTSVTMSLRGQSRQDNITMAVPLLWYYNTGCFLQCFSGCRCAFLHSTKRTANLQLYDHVMVLDLFAVILDQKKIQLGQIQLQHFFY